ncbi:MAG: DMT family protein [Proteobacteria bacterium]|nr:DMT family protein [Pseudomonadota bacterium]
MPAYLQTILLLICSNTFMTFAWYAHLKNLHNKALWVAILASWGIAFFEYLFQVPGNRIGFNSGTYTLAQLKIIQEVITLSVFVPFAIFYMHQPISWNFLLAGICLIGAVYFIFQ